MSEYKFFKRLELSVEMEVSDARATDALNLVKAGCELNELAPGACVAR